MDILVLFATMEGHTRKVAETIAGHLEARGHAVDITEAGQFGYCDPGAYDAAILCAPIHIGRYPESFRNYVNNWKDALDSVPNALISLSLAIASKFPDEVAEARKYPESITQETGWEPQTVHHAAGALKYQEYDFFRRWALRRIAEMEGGPTDTSRDHELTDWKALETFVEEFLTNADTVDGG